VQAAEWPATLDVAQLLANGWHPVPFREFVLKVHSRCNLACDYCYMYEMADQSWRAQPKRMTRAVAEQTAARIAEHVRAHALTDVSIVLHGGEPLLAGPETIEQVVSAVRAQVGEQTTVRATIQTNAALLSEEYLELFRNLDLHVGVSVDGGEQAHDRHRRYANGRGSYAAVAEGLHRMIDGGYRDLFNGVLCVVDIGNDPIATYEGLLEFAPPRMDFLLPHGTWSDPPPGRSAAADSTPYADWLIDVFTRWYDDPRTDVRLFSEIIRLLIGRNAVSETVGTAPVSFVVVETDGSLAQVDSLRAAFHGAHATGLHIDRHSFDEALLVPQVAARQLGYNALSAQCQKCPVWRVCGGGLYSHRYRRGTGFANPSVYCPDLLRLIEHINSRVRADVDARLAERNTGQG
jgi:uncharacterized protein